MKKIIRKEVVADTCFFLTENDTEYGVVKNGRKIFSSESLMKSAEAYYRALADTCAEIAAADDDEERKETLKSALFRAAKANEKAAIYAINTLVSGEGIDFFVSHFCDTYPDGDAAAFLEHIRNGGLDAFCVNCCAADNCPEEILDNSRIRDRAIQVLLRERKA